MNSCFEIFATWDDEYEKLQALLRDIVKKKKEEMKLAWKVNPTHKRLQMRLDQIRKSVKQCLVLLSVAPECSLNFF
jgi:dynein heavy chain 1